MKYISYNREERNLCSHLFRLLLLDKENYIILREFLSPHTFHRFEIFNEVALLRDAYHYYNFEKKIIFVDEIVKLIKSQENINDCRTYIELNSELKDPLTTHPRQIKKKAKDLNYNFSESENIVYGCLQSYFNSKPDLAIVTELEIIVYEAKLTLGFDKSQIEKTNKIVEIWSNLLYQDLGYSSIPKYTVKKLGLGKYQPDISWEKIEKIISNVLPNNDKSLIAIKKFLTNYM